jgi:hypothetical protein
MAVNGIITRFIDWVLGAAPSGPDIEDAVRVQKLLDAARNSASSGGCRITI